ncbi:MAG: HepT-like ribonuclease domain-containing protein [Cyanobacteria bacterium J06634_5]
MTAQSVPSLPTILRQRLQASAAEIVTFCQRWHVEELGLFGSVIRNDFGPESDIDVLVVFESSPHQVALSQINIKEPMQDEIAALFGRKVDLTEKRLLKNPFSKSEILSTHRVIYPPERANFTTLLEADQSMTDSTRNNAALLNMVNAMKSLQSFTQARSFEMYMADELLRLGTERALEILGEAANRLTPEFQAEHADIDWRNIVGVRNAIIHQYDDIDYETIWKIATVQVPILRKQIEPLLSPLPEE